jgi:hypothetical protein
MDAREIARVLTKAAAFDLRTVGEGDILAWADAIGDLDLPDALAAVSRHYRTSTERLMPAHIRRHVDEIRRERIRAAQQDAAAEQALETARAAVPARDRKAEVDALIADLRDKLPPVDEHNFRRAEVLGWERARARHLRAVPNPHYDPTITPPEPPSTVEETA